MMEEYTTTNYIKVIFKLSVLVCKLNDQLISDILNT